MESIHGLLLTSSPSIHMIVDMVPLCIIARFSSAANQLPVGIVKMEDENLTSFFAISILYPTATLCVSSVWYPISSWRIIP